MKNESTRLRLVIPTGRMFDEVVALLADAGLTLRRNGKEYRPAVSDDRFEVKLLKAANIPKLVELGAHDIGFSGKDWISETDADVATLLDTGLLPVRIVAAAPAGCDPFARNPNRPVIVASEYEQLTRRYMETRGAEYRYIRTFGATEVFPPEDADLIVDNVATGRTLAANGLSVVDEILKSSTVLLANRRALSDPARRVVIDELQLLIQSVLDARCRVLLDLNVGKDRLDAVVAMLPAMKSPTVQPLFGGEAYAVRAAVPRADARDLLVKLRGAGATDILQSEIQRVLI